MLFRGGARAEPHINARLPVVVMTVIVIFLSAPNGVRHILFTIYFMPFTVITSFISVKLSGGIKRKHIVVLLHVPGHFLLASVLV